MPATAEDSPAIRKLGQLFRLTEVYLWDDSYGAGPHDGRKNWRSAEAALVDSHTDKTCNEASNGTDKGHLFVEDLELANLMGSLGLPVSFSTSKVNKNTGNKGKKKGRQALLKAAKTQINDAVRICANTEDRESAVESLDVMAHMHSCNLSGTPLGHNEPCHDDTDKMLREDSPCVEEQEESGCSTIYSSDKAPSCDAKNLLTELGTFELSDNLGNPAKEDYSIQENQASDSVLLDSEEMPRHDCVDGESTHSCVDIYQEERVSTREDQTSEETLSVSHDHNDVGQEASLSLAEPSSIDEHAQSSANNFYYDYGEWRVVWDPFYSRYYFYNIQTQESTWCPPEGLEDFASYCSPDTTKELVELGSQCTSIAPQENNLATDDNHLEAQEQDHCIHDLSDIPVEKAIYQSMITTSDKAQHTENKYSDSTTIVLEMNQEVTTTKKKKRVRRSQSYHSCQDMAGNISNDIIKYWTQRYSLFSLFDRGIKMDEEGWFSVTPEPIAKHHASRVGAGVIIDCFTGVGGNAIQFATKCKHVIAVDIDPQKIDCAHHNASIYGVNDHIDFIVGDFIHIAPHLKGETAFMSPPWGGPDYAKVDVYDMKSMLLPCDGYSLFKLGTMIASRVVMFLPRNIDLNQLADMSLSVDPPWSVEVEKNFLNGKLKAITAYFEEQDC
ncbi:hypothetical protein BDA96_01G370200 [Sorghum bicolor]|uniref:Trimethylguanosine synthase n=2 Tax=Sorghum bicolor TaxID=4558 RepID=A0A921S2G6_SORBI|nr:uncharacterized protein LOC8080440 [Sorghum bicolor]KAG0550817.1 hypothetical protein BDA96_01G370200 [Sorghum bicolor]KXG39199.1 hypothetical protein SORBI_3001G346900 [Sorghum bicolor]|eukprot:XP_021306909.1 uncharacterized protein LOC8080440 [Sorghum bicolor]